MKNKKAWIFVGIILVIIAVVLTIVFVNLFTDKNTKQLSNNLHNVVEDGYLNKDEEENKAFKEYLNKIVALKPETSQYLSAFEAFEIYGEFFNREFVFTKYTNVYKKNRKSTLNSFSSAQKSANNLNSYLKDTTSAQQDEYWLNQTWLDCEKYVVNIINETSNAMQKLFVIYQAGAVENLHANDFTKAIMMATENCIKTLKSDKKGESGANLLSMAQNYLTLENEENILKYQNNQALQEKIEIILGEKGDSSKEYESLLAGTILV